MLTLYILCPLSTTLFCPGTCQLRSYHSHRMCTTAIKINILEKGFRSYTPYGCNNRERMKEGEKKKGCLNERLIGGDSTRLVPSRFPKGYPRKWDWISMFRPFDQYHDYNWKLFLRLETKLKMSSVMNFSYMYTSTIINVILFGYYICWKTRQFYFIRSFAFIWYERLNKFTIK